jgi:hypothetical protein
MAIIDSTAEIDKTPTTPTTTEANASGRDPVTGQFKKGHKWAVGHGRPVGARDRHTRCFLEAFAADFEAHGASVIERTRIEKPDVYLRIAADLLPKHAELNVGLFADAESFAEAFRLAPDVLGANPPLVEIEAVDD